MYMQREIEREVRYLIDEEKERIIKENCQVTKEEYRTVDIVVGLAGFDSLEKYGYIIRIRDKGNKIYVENKRLLANGDFKEERIPVDDIKTPLNFFMNIGYNPYLVIDRHRLELKYKNLKIFIDNICLLGKYVEIEYQDSNIDELNEFLSLVGINYENAKLYGDIFKEKVQDESFNLEFQKVIKKII